MSDVRLRQGREAFVADSISIKHVVNDIIAVRVTCASSRCGGRTLVGRWLSGSHAEDDALSARMVAMGCNPYVLIEDVLMRGRREALA